MPASWPIICGGFAPDPPLPFLPLMEEKEAKEDQGAKGRPPSWPGTWLIFPAPGWGSFLPLMEEKEAKEDQGATGRRPSWPGTRQTSLAAAAAPLMEEKDEFTAPPLFLHLQYDPFAQLAAEGDFDFVQLLLFFHEFDCFVDAPGCLKLFDAAVDVGDLLQ